METGEGRFRRTDRYKKTRRDLRAELLALRYELEQFDKALGDGPTSITARAALDHAYSALQEGEQAWEDSRRAGGLLEAQRKIDIARDAFETSVQAHTRRRRARTGA
jgi:hypothetical protein